MVLTIPISWTQPHWSQIHRKPINPSVCFWCMVENQYKLHKDVVLGGIWLQGPSAARYLCQPLSHCAAKTYLYKTRSISDKLGFDQDLHHVAEAVPWMLQRRLIFRKVTLHHHSLESNCCLFYLPHLWATYSTTTQQLYNFSLFCCQMWQEKKQNKHLSSA